MNNIQYKLIILLFITLALPNIGFSQSNTTDELRFEVDRVYPYISVSKEQLKEANNITDLNKHFKSSWVRTYHFVEVLASHKGKLLKAVSENDSLSQEQKNIMDKADVDTEISIKIQYTPENTLKNKERKEINFAFTVDPENEAEYIGGTEQLKKYLKEKAIDKISDDSFDGKKLSAIKFTISEEGEIIDADIFDSEFRTSENEKADELLLKTIRNMPCWKPAAYANGTKVKQDFVLTVGNMESCLINLIGYSRD